ncbi:MAG: NADH-quinone oxidoreductase subunit L, partial [Solirubrobacteraceae bacterium]
MSTTTYGWLILLFPLIGTVVIGLGFRLQRGSVAGAIGTLAILLSFASAVGALISLLGRPESAREVTSSLWNYASTVGVDGQMSILVDPLSILMALVVSGVSTLIHLYSVAYLKTDRGYSRFFAYLNFFVFSMLLLVMAGNFLLLIVGWAFVGFASYI